MKNNSKTFLLHSLFALITLTFLSTSSFAKTAPANVAFKVGIVNLKKVIEETPEGKKLKDQLKSFYDEKQQILKKEEEEIKKSQESFTKQRHVLNADVAMKKEDEIRRQVMAIQQKSMQYQQELQGLELKLRGPIMKNMEVAIGKVSNETNVDVVFEVAQSPLYIRDRNKTDLTDKVIEAMKKIK